jgi:hypothetical protein
MVGDIQETLAEADSDKLPSPALLAITVWVEPFWPTAMNTGPTAAVDNLSMGVAAATPQHMHPMKTLRETILIQSSFYENVTMASAT